MKAVPIDGQPTAPTAARSPYLAGLAAALAVAITIASSACGSGTEGRVRRLYDLGRRPTEPNKAKIEGMAQDPEADVRGTALVVLDSVDHARAAHLVDRALGDPEGSVRAAAAKIAGADVASRPELVGRLAGLAGDDPDWQVRRQALAGLAKSEDPAAMAAFGRALSDSVHLVRRTALEAGAARQGLLPLDKVAELVAKDPDWENRVAAAAVLGAQADGDGYAALDVAATDPNEFVRAAAVAARRDMQKRGVEVPAPPAPEEKPRGGVIVPAPTPTATRPRSS